MDGVGVLLETRSCLVSILNLGDGMGFRGSRGESAASWDPWRYGAGALMQRLLDEESRQA